MSWSQGQCQGRGEWVIGKRGIVEDEGVYDANLRLQQEGIIDLIALIILVRLLLQVETGIVYSPVLDDSPLTNYPFSSTLVQGLAPRPHPSQAVLTTAPMEPRES